MPIGTARNRLVKALLYQFAFELGKANCFKCSELIDSIEEFTIEHKEPWENRDPKLYWDLSNIAFSHAKCNKRHTSRSVYCRKGHTKSEQPNGKWTCKTCAIKNQVNYRTRK